MSSIWGNNLKISVFGESHGKAIGVTIDGLPPGEKLNLEDIKIQMKRRMPANSNYTTLRYEEDDFEILSGILNNKTTGSPVCIVIRNKNVDSKYYSENNFLPRPGHADFTSNIRYNGFQDSRGGGHLSGRLTASIVFAGSICRQILERKGIIIGSHISSIENIFDMNFNFNCINKNFLKKLSLETFPMIDKNKKEEIKERINQIKKEKDSLGGTIQCAVVGLPRGIGNPIFENLESKISSIIFSIPAVKAIEFGNGIESSFIKGSENNDEFVFDDFGNVKTISNNCGGILGGISTGMPIVFKVYFKPTPSIEKVMKTVNLKNKSIQEISTKGRHDPCIALRGASVVEAATAIAILDIMKL